MGDAYQEEVQDTTHMIPSHLISAVASAELSPLSCLTVLYLWYGTRDDCSQYLDLQKITDVNPPTV